MVNPGLLLPPPSFLPRRYKPRNVGSWSGHLAFANDLIVATRPSLIAELGTHWGESYFTFCQTIQEHSLSCLCYAVDHWLGDEHAGHYGEEVFDEVSQYNHRYYLPFSYLMRMSFDDALSQFTEDSIDLLHIDGLHTYEAVSHDFRSWLPKVRSSGIILLHDISPRHEDFGVWRLWNEIKEEFADTFEFHHSWGLGVVRKSGKIKHSSLTQLLFEGNSNVKQSIRSHYAVYASHLENLLNPYTVANQSTPPHDLSQEVQVQVFPHCDSGYSEENSQARRMKTNVWSTVVFDIRSAGVVTPLRIDPGSCPSFIEVGDIQMHSPNNGDIIWNSLGSDIDRDIAADGTSKCSISDMGVFVVSTGADPQIIVAPSVAIKGPVKLTVSLRIVPTSYHAVKVFDDSTSRLNSKATDLKTKIVAVQNTAQREQELLLNKLTAIETQLVNVSVTRDQIQQVLNQTRQELRQTHQDLATTGQELDRSRLQLDQTNQQLRVVENRLLAGEDTLYQMQHSLSWRVTEPIRKFMYLLRARFRANKTT
jgi:hypothetical protein